MGYLREMILNQQSEPPHRYTYEPLSRNPGSAPVIPSNTLDFILVMVALGINKLVT